MKTALAAVSLLTVLLAGTATASDRAGWSDVMKRSEYPGECFKTRVGRITNRLEDQGRPVAGSGSAIVLADGHYNVSYDQLPAIDRSRPGDPVRLCVLSVPHHCPPNDNRGITYRGRNLRTGLSWRATDAEHFCGGA